MILNFHNKNHIPMINLYKKSSGIALVQKYLPEIDPCDQIYMIDSIEDWEQIKNLFSRKNLTMRSDSKKAEELAKCPHALSGGVEKVPAYIQKVQNAVKRWRCDMYGYD